MGANKFMVKEHTYCGCSQPNINLMSFRERKLINFQNHDLVDQTKLNFFF